jgi:hypothetical protein
MPFCLLLLRIAHWVLSSFQEWCWDKPCFLRSLQSQYHFWAYTHHQHFQNGRYGHDLLESSQSLILVKLCSFQLAILYEPNKWLSRNSYHVARNVIISLMSQLHLQMKLMAKLSSPIHPSIEEMQLQRIQSIYWLSLVYYYFDVIDFFNIVF